MDITPLVPKDRQILNRYGDGGFVVGDVSYKGNILLGPSLATPWDSVSLEQATSESLEPLFTGELPEILLVGTGAQFKPVPAVLRNACRARGVAVDGMDTGAACRTYTVLLAEGRQVAAALIAI